MRKRGEERRGERSEVKGYAERRKEQGRGRREGRDEPEEDRGRMLCRHGTLASGLESRALRPRRCIASFRSRSSFSFSFSLSPVLLPIPSPLSAIEELLSAPFVLVLFPRAAARQYAARSCIPPMVECSIRRNGSGGDVYDGDGGGRDVKS